ncbi:disease resistance protein Roq1-like [Quercus suber]|uniref:disease resistance protein Roq1-like n=1 Tax=Quercus suber TaxID=58331 RepID=UPI0032DFA7F1
MAFLAIENASSSSSSIHPSSTSVCKYEYDVFLSFRGTDTRNNFTDHLYYRLKQEGIFTFRDNERLEQGTEINSGLLRAIDESKIAVVVLSKQYASSSWCLIELAKIVECMDKKKLTVLPVFHYVDPSDVSSESEVIKKSFKISSELDHEVPFVSEHLVGMDSRVKEMLDLCLGERLNCVRLVGICGMGGIEQSLSKILVGTEKNILDVEEGKKILRNRLCNKKVLIVLDDVNDDEQLKALAGKDWFGLGSIIIVTSRDIHLLNTYWDGVIDIYIAKGLNYDEAMELFSLKALRNLILKKIMWICL